MYIATITSQGQITIPAEARRKVGLRNGDRLMIVPVGDTLEIKKDEGIASLKGIFSKGVKNNTKVSDLEIQKIREEMYTQRFKENNKDE